MAPHPPKVALKQKPKLLIPKRWSSQKKKKKTNNTR